MSPNNGSSTRSVFITGAARGIGRAIAEAFAGPDVLLALADIDEAGLAGTAAIVRARGADALALTTDVSESRSVAAAIERYRDRAQTLDVLINDAGIGGGELVEGSDEARWRRTIDVNLTGAYLVCRAALPLIANGGRIINMASVLGRFGVPEYTAYCASKHGIIGFTRALALEVASRRITVNAICPGWVDTAMAALGIAQGARSHGVSEDEIRQAAVASIPLGRILDPSDVAGLALFLASPQAASITGQAYNICGGQVMS